MNLFRIVKTFVLNPFKSVLNDNIHVLSAIFKYCLGNNVPLSDILRDFKTFSAKELFKLIGENPIESRKEWMLVAFKKAGKINPLNQ